MTAMTHVGGVPLTSVLPALRALEPAARACWLHDLDAVESRARHFGETFSALDPLVAYALKANALPAVLARVRAAGIGAEAGSLGELEIARRCGFTAAQRVLNGNGRTSEEAEWAARVQGRLERMRGVSSVAARAER